MTTTSTWRATYSPSHHIITLNKAGACAITLTPFGGVKMSDDELNFYGDIMAKALSDMTPDQIAQAKAFKRA